MCSFAPSLATSIHELGLYCICFFFGIIRYIERANQKIAKKSHKNKKQIQKKRKGESTNTNRKKEEKNIKIGETDTSCLKPCFGV